MSNKPKKSVVPQPPAASDGAAAHELPPSSPVKVVKDWLRRRKTTSSKNKDALKSVKSQSRQFVAPGGCRLNMAMVPNDVTVFTTRNNHGDLVFNQAVGTKKSAKTSIS